MSRVGCLFVEKKENGLESTLKPRPSDSVLYVSLDLALYAMTNARRASPTSEGSRECAQSKQADQNAFLRGVMRSLVRILVPRSRVNLQLDNPAIVPRIVDRPPRLTPR